MALSSTLIRTYAIQYPTLPAFALGAVNRRILSDTRGSMFVTAFYAVLDPNTGRIRYVNAGHNPPYLVSGNRGKPVDRLRGTGMALGVDEEAIWQQKVIRMVPGDVLLMYTDGVTEAQNPQGEYFGEQRMLDIVRARMGCPAREIQDAVLTAVREFTGGVGSSDDITLMVVARKS
jgi:serine phosphatase RsbU (regulator of sigma subunit)